MELALLVGVTTIAMTRLGPRQQWLLVAAVTTIMGAVALSS